MIEIYEGYSDLNFSIKIPESGIAFYVEANKSEDKELWGGNISLYFPEFGFSGTELENFIDFEYIGNPTTDKLIERAREEIVFYLENLTNYVKGAK